MDQQIKSFLIGIIGDRGQEVVERLCKNSPELESVLVPRALMSWVSVLSNLDKYEGNIPGIDGKIRIEKSNKTYHGEIKINDNLIKIENDSILTVAATLAVNLNIDVDGISKEIDRNRLAVLGKTLDLITKSKFISNHNNPVVVQTEIPATPTILPTPIKKSLTISFEDMNKSCSICGIKQFNNKCFTGCKCLKSMAKSTSSEIVKNGCRVTFKGKEWDEEALKAFIKMIRG
jgi:hypothetical protein